MSDQARLLEHERPGNPSYARSGVSESMSMGVKFDLLLRALPYLHFATVVGGVILQKREVQVTFLAEGLPSEFHLGFGAGSVETGNRWKVDIYCTMQDGSTFAIEAVMAARGPAVIEEHRNRFEQVPNYKDAKHKEGRTAN